MKFTDYFAYQVRMRPQDPCMTDDSRELTYLDADRDSTALAAALGDLPPQSRVAVVADNSVDFLLLDLATTKANLVLVPLNTRLNPAEWAQLIDHAEARIVFVGENYCAAMETVRTRLEHVGSWVALGAVDRPGWTAAARLTPGAARPDRAGCGDDHDIDVQLYTSGTTGQPKGVLHSHDSMTMSISQWAQMVEPWDGLRNGRSLVVAPLFHGAALIMWRTTACWGGHVQTQPRFDVDAVLDAAVRHPISWTFLVPSMIHACLERIPRREPADYRFNLIMYGGSPIAEVILRGALGDLGRHFLQIYGMTESLLTTTLTPADHVRALDGHPELLLAAGRPVAGVGLVIHPSDGAPAARTVGELVVTCPNPMIGYSKNDEATAAILHDGGLHTGDAGFIDADGYLHLCGRIKDMIVTGGENVYSTEVEDVLHAHPAVADVAVIGTPDPKWGEVVTAILVARPGATIDVADVVSFCRDRIARYKVPKRIEIADRLPRNSMGKLLKHQVRERYCTPVALS
ncbi:AMP-binding protein [Gordonia sp. TBRC 11910]|uniref:AMP-binding protein n=1 Tax=Gordonia asplenii TaxID=2725283 RepID=A0A848L2Y7_9ACTN|nr:AMP-binding protein [Gordonia asplenii]NMO02921.1 AMP-binding protein [Gordonia asplenii]